MFYDTQGFAICNRHQAFQALEGTDTRPTSQVHPQGIIIRHTSIVYVHALPIWKEGGQEHHQLQMGDATKCI